MTKAQSKTSSGLKPRLGAMRLDDTGSREAKYRRAKKEAARAKKKAERRELQANEWREQWRRAQKLTEDPKNRWPGMPPDDLPRFAGNDVGCPTGGMGQLESAGAEGPKPLRSSLASLQGK